MTERLYYNDAGLTRWTTRVMERMKREDGLYVRLERSAFYPEGGGQPCDTGTIGGVRVLEVVSEGEQVLHRVERLPDGEVDGEVECAVDEERRFDHMQQHSGQHLLSAVCLSRFGARTLSFHLGEDASTIDVERAELTQEELALLEREVNAEVYAARPIRSYFVTEAEAARLPLVKAPTVSGAVRIVEIEGVEYNACGGTHVSTTGGIGLVRLLRTERMKGQTRITFLCGNRALADYRAGSGLLARLYQRFNTAKDELPDRLDKQEQELKRLQLELAQAKEQLDELAAQELLMSGGPLVAAVYDQKPLKELQSLAAKLTAGTDRPVLLADRAEAKVVLAHSGRFTQSCGTFFKEHLGAYQGKGGGSATLAQAGFASWEAAEAFYRFAEERLRDV